MADGIITSLKKKFNELGNERLMEIYEIQSLYADINNQINSEGSKVSMIIEPDDIDSVALAEDIKSKIDTINELDNGPTKDFNGETFYNLDDANSVYNFDYSVDELEESVPQNIQDPQLPKNLSSSDYNFSEIVDEPTPEEINDVPPEETNNNEDDTK